MQVMSKSDWLSFVDRLIREDPSEIVGVKSKGPKFVFDELDSAEELRLDYDVTILPPKKYFLPVYEDMMKYDLTSAFSVDKMVDIPPRIVIGVHPYDLVAMEQMDKVYLGDTTDELYKARREKTLIIASDILNVSEDSFAGSMGTNVSGSGYDLLVTDLGDSVAVDVGSEKGGSLLSSYANAGAADDSVEARVAGLREGVASGYSKSVDVDKADWPGLLTNNHEHSVWEEKSDKCLECGSCTLVCPTCYCFDVNDTAALNLESGVRTRTWDGCMMRDFSLVGGGEVFREGIKERYQHRIYRKGMYIPERYGFTACVGCGRCVSACLPDIADPSDVMNKLVTSSMGVPKPLPIPEAAPAAEGLAMVPRPATIVRTETMTEKEKLFEIKLDDGMPLGHGPGQFVEISIFGVGEAPISVSSAPGGDTFEIVVRKVGDVTGKLHGMDAGDKIGIRGPLGTGFDAEALKGKNLLFIAGGLGVVPMRSLFNHVLRNRADYGEVTILYGCKDPSELLFGSEVKDWEGRDDLVHKFTVDACPEGEEWEHNVGVVGTLIPQVQFDPNDTTAIVVGPPIMYRFVIRDLKEAGIPDENIIVSLERRMECGIGKCGHCQINGVYVCKEGPVFNYADMKDLPEAF